MTRGRFVYHAFVLFMMIALITACSSGQSAHPNQPTPAPAGNSVNPTTAEQPANPTPAPAPEKTEWDQLVEDATKDGKLIIFGQANNLFRDRMIEGFNKQFPGITVEYRSGTKAADVVSKISAEKRAGVHEVDILLWGANTTYGELIPAGYVAPITDYFMLEDFKKPELWVQNKLEFADNEEKYIVPYSLTQGNQILVNTSLVDVSTLKSYNDLLRPDLKGKMVVSHPKDVGQSRYAFSFFYEYYGEEYFAKLAAQEPEINQDVKQLIDWVAQGKYAIGISPGNDVAFQEYIDSGIPIVGLQLQEGGYYSPGYNNLSVLTDAPHSNAAKLFVNWAFTKEGQEVLSHAALASSIRKDVENPLAFESGKTYFAPHLQKNEEVAKKAIEIFDKYFK